MHQKPKPIQQQYPPSLQIALQRLARDFVRDEIWSSVQFGHATYLSLGKDPILGLLFICFSVGEASTEFWWDTGAELGWGEEGTEATLAPGPPLSSPTGAPRLKLVVWLSTPMKLSLEIVISSVCNAQ